MTVVSVHPEVEEEVRAAMRERKKQSEEGEGEAG